MFRLENFRSLLGLSIAAMLLVVINLPLSDGAAPAASASAAPLVNASAPGSGECLQVPPTSGESVAQAPEHGSCKADSKESTFLGGALAGGRTCRCSCGYPCKTDADCGGAIGSCRGGISCC